jgi:hypothetical protein
MAGIVREAKKMDAIGPCVIRYSDGRSEVETDTYGEALDAITAEWPDAEIGHDGDLTDHGDRTLCWADEESSRNDDGAHAVASIYRAR